MKRFLVFSYLLLALTVFSSQGWALTLTMTDIGTWDTIVDRSANLSGDSAELNFINTELEASYQYLAKVDWDNTTPKGDGWNEVVDDSQKVIGYAFDFETFGYAEPNHFLIKQGTWDPNQYLFNNLDNTRYAAFAIVDITYATSVFPISHISWASNTPVPEPATMLLFGLGLLGLAGVSRKNKVAI